MDAQPRPVVLVAPNAFKGSLSAVRAATAMVAGVRREWPRAEVVRLPLADGGDGFLETLVAAGGGHTSRQRVAGPLGAQVWARVGWLEDGGGPTAVVELASAAGLALVPSPGPESAGKATTRGLGELIRLALDRYPARVLIGIGGSATSDGGSGLARALGYRFLGSRGEEIPEGGLGLLQLDRIVAEQADPRLLEASLLAACDVSNPLLGSLGAAAVYGPQKGADPATVELLEEGLARLAEVASRDLGAEGAATLPGAGAAGGAGFGLVAFARASLTPGLGLVAGTLQLDQRLAEADLVLTGEGRFDQQSLSGKVPGEVARRARELGVPCLVIAGSCEESAAAELAALGGRLVLAPGPPREGAAARLSQAARRACRLAPLPQ